jgi:hypothetical protein
LGEILLDPDEYGLWMTDEDGWGRTDLSGLKLKNSNLIHVRLPWIRPSLAGTGESRAGPDESWWVGMDRFFYQFRKKINKPLKTPKTPKTQKIPEYSQKKKQKTFKK